MSENLTGRHDEYRPTDDFFGTPYIDQEERRDWPQPYLYLHGGFEGTDTRFSLHFPDAEFYQGRFVQPLMGALGGDENTYSTPFGELLGGRSVAFGLGAYMVETNQGHIGSTLCPKAGTDASIYGHRASAEAARFARHLAARLYGQAPHHGYVFGGSGGARRSVNCLENVPDVWDGAMPFMGGGSSIALDDYDAAESADFTAQGFSAMFNVQRLLGERLHDVIDAIEPGGSGDPYATLNCDQREALADLYRHGYPRGDEFMIAHPMGQIGLWAWSAESIKAQDPDYWTRFWTQTGYAGYDTPHLFEGQRIDTKVTVSRVLTAGEIRAQASSDPASIMAMLAPPDLPLAIEVTPAPDGYVLGSSLRVETGDAAGRQLWCTGTIGDALRADGIGEAGNLGFKGVKPGDSIAIDNHDFLAFCYYYRHFPLRQKPDGPLTVDSLAIFPQHAPQKMETQMGPHFNGRFASPDAKLLFVQHTHDSSLWPGNALRYAQVVRNVQGDAARSHFALRWVQNAEHIPTSLMQGLKPAATTRLINYQGAIEQSLHDLIHWVEDGIVPAQDDYSVTPDGAFRLDADADVRGGIQPMVHVTADGAARAVVAPGATVRFDAHVKAPPHAGTIVSAAWDFDGSGAFAHVVEGIDGTATEVRFSFTHAFDEEGVYFPALLVYSHRDGDMQATGRRVANLGRTRVVVQPG